MRVSVCVVVAAVVISCGGTSGGGSQDAGIPMVAVTITVAGPGSVKVPGIDCRSSCRTTLPQGTSLHIEAAPDPGARFSGWSGACSGVGACDVVVAQDVTVSAAFAAISPPQRVTLSVTVSGSGHVTSAPAGIACPANCSAAFDVGSGVQLTATADSSFAFAGWSGACAGQGTCAVTMTADQTVGASFAVTSVITSCRPITAPGTYAVTGQISSSDTCLDIHDTHGVTIDCGGQTVGGSPALVMTNVDGFSIKNCHFVPTASFYLANLLHVSNGTFQHDTFGSAPVNVVHAADVRIDQNTFNASYWQSYSHRVVLSSNTLVSSARGSAFAGAMIGSTFGSDNQFVGNVMDGKWAGSGQTETDDGVVIGDESGDVVSGNTISNVFDCGIETSGVIANATISNNNITRTGFCGIGGWYWNSLKASTISGNVATGVPRLFHFFRIFGLRPARFDSLHEMPADAAVYFNDNVFDGNRLVNPSTQATSSSIIRVYDQLDYSGSVSSVIPGERAPGSSDFILSNNIFRNNDFGHTLLAPDFGAPVVPGLVIDGGGNICNVSGGVPYPLACQ